MSTDVETVIETSDGEELILRYNVAQRYIHLALAVSFVTLLASGLAILWRPAAELFAAGGWTTIVHRVAAVIFLSVPIVYVVVAPKHAKELLVDSFRMDRDDVSWLKLMGRYARGYAVGMPKQGRLNAGQKLHHASVIITSATAAGSGLTLWWFKSNLGDFGLTIALLIHDLSMLALTLLMVGHLYFTYVYRALPAMTTGYVPLEDAEIEHAKWVEEVTQEAAELDTSDHDTSGHDASDHDTPHPPTT